MRSLPTEALIQIASRVTGTNVDGYVFPTPPGDVLASGNAAKIPVLLGNNVIEDMSPGGDLQKKVTSMYRSLGPKAVSLYVDEKSAAATSDPRFGKPSEQF